MDQITKRKLYTKHGDKGYTYLIGNNRSISKGHLRIEACGTLDELNAFLGSAIVAIKPYEQLTELATKCLRIQNELFDLGAYLLSYPLILEDNLAIINLNEVTVLEKEIDHMALQVTELNKFILPGGSEAVARLHITRTVCRRLERVLVRLAELVKFDEIVLTYVNRLSDWLFIASRFVTKILKQNEMTWQHEDVK